MKKCVGLLAVTAGLMLFAANGRAQEAAKPAAELEHLKDLVGTWDATMEGGKGTMTYKMDLGGLWLVGDFQGEFGGGKFSGRGFDSYDQNKKKYVGLWVDSMSTYPMVMEGNYDAAKKVLTMTGEGPGHDGKITKWKSVNEIKDKDTMVFKMYTIGADGKETQAMTINYKRKK
jgi:hypothetical protein